MRPVQIVFRSAWDARNNGPDANSRRRGPVSVAGNDGKVLLVPVMPGNQFYMSGAQQRSDALGSLCPAVLQVPDPDHYQRTPIQP